MEKTKVYLESIHHYDAGKIEELLYRSIDFLRITIPESAKILLKPNVLGIFPPENHINTHPAVVEAVVRILQKKKNTIILGDSSGNSQYGNTPRALEKSGMKALGEKYGFPVNAFDKHTNRIFRNDANVVFREINLTTYIDEVDYIVNMPKLKTHTFTVFSGAVKNFYGCIPGAGKPKGHKTAPAPEQFCQGLVDLYQFVSPKIVLNVMDGIIGISGNGPGPAGKISEAGFIGASANAFALDHACFTSIGGNPDYLLTDRIGRERGFFSGEIEKNIDIRVVDFKIPKTSKLEVLVNRFLPGFAFSRPFVIPSQCKKCGLCVKACPAGALSMKEFPSFEYKKCIYCFCCHENCPEAAIGLREKLIYKIFKSFT